MDSIFDFLSNLFSSGAGSGAAGAITSSALPPLAGSNPAAEVAQDVANEVSGGGSGSSGSSGSGGGLDLKGLASGIGMLGKLTSGGSSQQQQRPVSGGAGGSPIHTGSGAPVSLLDLVFGPRRFGGMQ